MGISGLGAIGRTPSSRTSTVPAAASPDTLFSSYLKSAQGNPSGTAAAATETASTPNVSELQTATDELTQGFTDELQRLLDEQGIDSTIPIRLEADAYGKVRVVGPHPDKERIEALFDEHADLSSQFNELRANASVLQGSGGAARTAGPAAFTFTLQEARGEVSFH